MKKKRCWKRCGACRTRVFRDADALFASSVVCGHDCGDPASVELESFVGPVDVLEACVGVDVLGASHDEAKEVSALPN
eukprot:7550839-Alexandrium_andersonii.AAC.1